MNWACRWIVRRHRRRRNDQWRCCERGWPGARRADERSTLAGLSVLVTTSGVTSLTPLGTFAYNSGLAGGIAHLAAAAVGTSGEFPTKITSLQASSGQLGSQITLEQQLVTEEQQQLDTEFDNLETTLSNLKSESTYLSSIFGHRLTPSDRLLEARPVQLPEGRLRAVQVEVDEMSPSESDVARAYAKTAASTVTNGPMLLVKLYDRLVEDVELAKTYLSLGDNQRASDAVQHAEKIVVVLRSSLQPDGFEGGRTLLALYNTLTDLLIKANLKKDAAVLELCQQIIAPLHDGWTRAVAREMEKERAGAQIGVA